MERIKSALLAIAGLIIAVAVLGFFATFGLAVVGAAAFAGLMGLAIAAALYGLDRLRLNRNA